MARKTPIQRDEAIKIVSQITEECNRHGACTHNCPFFYSHVRWCIFDGQPYDWPVMKEGGGDNGTDN